MPSCYCLSYVSVEDENIITFHQYLDYSHTIVSALVLPNDNVHPTFGESNFSTFATGGTTRTSRSRSQLQGRSHSDSKHASAHLPLMSNVHRKHGDYSSNTLDTAGIKRISISRSKDIGAPKYASAHIPLMGNVHAKYKDCKSNTLGAASRTRF